MTISLRRKPTDRLLELGGGANPAVHPRCKGGPDCNVDVRMVADTNGNQCVDFQVNFDEFPWPISSNEFDGVFSHFVIEHVNWRNVKKFIGEVYRILKPGGYATIVTANTKAQMEKVLATPEDQWGDEESRIIFGDMDYPENSHKNTMSPRFATKLFSDVGFINVRTLPYGAIQTDMLIQADKPANANGQTSVTLSPIVQVAVADLIQPIPASAAYDPAKTFNRAFFNGEGYKPFLWDEPRFQILFQKVMSRKPESVLELGCTRGYIVKRLQDAGIQACGIDISGHCYLTRVCNFLSQWDVTVTPWEPPKDWDAPPSIDLCFSHSFLERIPEDKLPAVFKQMEETCKRGLHGISFQPDDDKTKVTIRPKEWWIERLPRGHEVLSRQEMEQGQLSEAFLKGDGKIKLNIGCAWTMFHNGWQNIDILDNAQFAQMNGYQFSRQDVRNGLQYGTESVDLIFTLHFLEHLTYAEGLAFLKECRRVVKPDGAMRIVVPDAEKLAHRYVEVELLSDFDDINENCANAPTNAGKLWALLCEGHQSVYDFETLQRALQEAGFISACSGFRKYGDRPGSKQIIQETLDMHPAISLYVNAYPDIG